MSPGTAVAATVAANVLRGLGGPGWSVAPMVAATWNPVTGISTATGVEVAKKLGGNTSGFAQGWRDNGSSAVSAVAGLRWEF